ncbi:uncharacterized protein LAJ45_06833 [Morchella importuna]|uniref:uncharacterized protein n=1 Tax=Morchella importuna TaxID=1174673 RepID=UPI001E8EDDDA|nr:uncharacterized protein LAJ45_06833 [Morchella importuna]KAH8149293.1 hypothetical protein LAJ45_06833 [Morchella importuna]
MLLHIARRRMPAVAQKIHARSFIPSAAISSSTAFRTLENPSNESIRAQISQASISELKSQLTTRNLPTKGNRSQLIDRLSRSLSGSAPPLRAVVVNTIKHTEPGEAKRPEAKRPEAERPEAEHDTGNTGAEGSRDTGAKEARTPQAGEAKYQHNHPRDIPEMPDPSELDFKEKEGPIRVPLTPDNKFARYHRHEVVPEVAKPLKLQVTTVLPDASQVLDERTGDLAKVLEKISVEVKAHREQVQGFDNGIRETKEMAKGVVGNIAVGMQDMMGEDGNSMLRMIGRFPIDLAKDMMEDIMSAGKQFAEEEKRERGKKREREEDTGPQVLTSEERTVMYTIGGLSAAWYLLGY